ncbi:MAG: PQQ-binding-like beta-propeller repeat protein, partial [Planctomycetaceae bacterium]
MRFRNLALSGGLAALALAAVVMLSLSGPSSASEKDKTAETAGDYNPTQAALEAISKMDVGSRDWPMFFGWPGRNNTPEGRNIPIAWDVDSGENIKWKAKLGSQSYGNAVVANGRIFIGTNNGAGYIKRYPPSVDLGCLIAFDEKTGEFLWQHSNHKLPTGRVHDWPLQGVCSAAYVDGDKLWYVSNRGEVCCLDTEGFNDGENDGPFKSEPYQTKQEADVVWKFDLMGELGVSQHNMCACSVLCAGDVLLVNTSNGVDVEHLTIPAPDAPSFIGMDKNTGKVLWTDKSPGNNILHGQWSSPAYAVIDGRPQAIFGGGDGWVYSFDPKGDGQGNSKILWKFDANPKESVWIISGRGTRNNIIATPVIYDGMVFVAVGQDPEHGEGLGHLWCIDPRGEGNVSSVLAVDKDGNEIPHRRLQAIDKSAGEKEVPNPNSRMVWHYSEHDANGDGEIDFEETLHRSCGTVAIKDDVLYIADFSGLFHCLNARSGVPYWTHDMFAAAWGSPLIVDGKVYIGDEDGDVAIFKLSPEKSAAEPIREISMGNSVYSS